MLRRYSIVWVYAIRNTTTRKKALKHLPTIWHLEEEGAELLWANFWILQGHWWALIAGQFYLPPWVDIGALPCNCKNYLDHGEGVEGANRWQNSQHTNLELRAHRTRYHIKDTWYKIAFQGKWMKWHLGQSRIPSTLTREHNACTIGINTNQQRCVRMGKPWRSNPLHPGRNTWPYDNPLARFCWTKHSCWGRRMASSQQA